VLVTHIIYSFHYVPGPTCWGSTSLYVPPLSYKREGTQRYKAGSLRPSDRLSHRLSSSQTQYNTQWSRVLRFGGLNHSKTLVSSCVLPPSNRQAK
jgi:hypothetical protein